jgi:hypothetical protein
MSGTVGLLSSYGKKDTVLVLDLDAANYSAIPANGSTIAGAGAFAITTRNTGSSMSWSSTYGGIFSKTSTATTDFLEFGPDYSATSKAYTVMMVYRSGSTAGRLLNANTASPDWLMGVWDSPSNVQNIFFNGGFIGSNSTAATGAWTFQWVTYNGKSTSAVSQNYVATTAAPTTTFGTGSTNGGFNQLRLFGRYDSATAITEVGVYDVGLVKVWDGVLSLSQIQTEYNTYKTRFIPATSYAGTIDSSTDNPFTFIIRKSDNPGIATAFAQTSWVLKFDNTPGNAAVNAQAPGGFNSGSLYASDATYYYFNSWFGLGSPLPKGTPFTINW